MERKTRENILVIHRKYLFYADDIAIGLSMEVMWLPNTGACFIYVTRLYVCFPKIPDTTHIYTQPSKERYLGF